MEKEKNIIILMANYYLKGKRWKGIIKEYDKKDRLQFEGEYSNETIWNGIRYSLKNHSILYEIKKGKGFIKFFDGELRVIFEGE